MIYMKTNQWLANAIINGAKSNQELPIGIEMAEKLLNFLNDGELLRSANKDCKVNGIDMPDMYIVNKKYYFILGDILEFKKKFHLT